MGDVGTGAGLTGGAAAGAGSGRVTGTDGETGNGIAVKMAWQARHRTDFQATSRGDRRTARQVGHW